MACESCKVLVKEELEKLGLKPMKVELGEAETKVNVSEKKEKEFSAAIKKAGLELVKSKEAVLTDQVKALIAEYIERSASIKSNLSDYLSKNLHYDYAYLSSYFSAMQANTIEQYTIALKIEKVKELLVLDDLTLSQIADKLNYSSVAHLSSQFKKSNRLTCISF
jgi:AraC-like DNA-binding protein